VDVEQQSLAVSHPFTVFVLELVSSGYFGDTIGTSFRQEGRAMLDAVLDDFRRIPDVTATTILDDVEQLRAAFNVRADAVLCIAPEFDDLLRGFREFITRPWMRSLNCDAGAIALCADKSAFARHLSDHGFPTPLTFELELDDEPEFFPCVIKPRFGAGSWLVRRLQNLADWQSAVELYQAAGLTELLCQPVITGQACSVAALVWPDHLPEILPIAEQNLSVDGEFRYLGGRIPAELPEEDAWRVQTMLAEVITTIPGLNGYIGCDIIVTEQGHPRIIELNPRLTTSYIGYRRLCADNLMERLLFPERFQQALRWKPGTVTFDPDATCRYVET